MESRTCQSSRYIIRIRGILAVSVESRGEGRAEGEPESSEGAEDDEGEGIAEKELEDAAETHEEAANEVVGAYRGDAVPARSPPAHQLAGEWAKAEEEAEEG